MLSLVYKYPDSSKQHVQYKIVLSYILLIQFYIKYSYDYNSLVQYPPANQIGCDWNCFYLFSTRVGQDFNSVDVVWVTCGV